jgi:putative zinc finger protein
VSEPNHEFEHGYTCIEVVELATEFIEGSLTPQEATLFELHLNFCDGCDSFLDQIRRTSELARELSEDEVPDDVKSGLMAAFRDWRHA